VRLYSKPDISTSAKLYLPKVLDAASPTWTPVAEPKTAVAAPHGKQGEKVLVVEDEVDVRRYTVDSLRELGYRVSKRSTARRRWIS
jgi:hypothetical protein